MERELAFCVHADRPAKEVNSGSVGLHTHSCLPLSAVALTQVPCTARSHLHNCLTCLEGSFQGRSGDRFE